MAGITGKGAARYTLAVAALFVAAAWLAPAAAEPALNGPAPELTIQTLGGRTFDLGALRGKAVLVKFWATWCAPCREEFPVIAKFYSEHSAQGFEAVALSIDKPAARAKMQRIASKLPFEAALLSEASRNGFGTPEAVPVSYVIDAKGVVRDKFIQIDKELLEEVVLPLVKEAEADRETAGKK